MNLPRISYRRFLNSRWFAYSVITVLLTAMMFGGFQYRDQNIRLKESQSTVSLLQQRIERTTNELAQAEYSLQQERKRITSKVREERRADGTIIVEREQSSEESESDSRGSSSSERSIVESEETKSRVENEIARELEQSSSQSQYSVGLGVASGFNLDYGYVLELGLRLGNLPIWLGSTVELNAQSYAPRRFGLGLSFEF